MGHQPIAWPLATVVAFAITIAAFLSCTAWRSAARIGWFFGAGYFAIAFSWLPEPFLVFPLRHGWGAPFAVALMAGGFGLFWAAAFAGAFSLGSGPVTRALALACLIMAAGALRESLFTGFPWGLPSYVWAETPVAQLLAYIGPHGLTMCTLLAAASPLLLRRLWAGVGLGAVLVATGWAIGAVRLSRDAPYLDDPPVVRIVQPNIPQDQKWNRDLQQENFLRLLALSRSDVNGRRPDLVVWPETSAPQLLRDDIDEIPVISQAAGGASTVFGVRRFSEGKIYNSLAVVAPDGSVTGTYDKRHLVPFGEYIPFSELMSAFGIDGLVEGAGGFSRGAGPAVIDTGVAGALQIMICYEIVFPREVRSQDRSNGMLQITNDAWFGSFSGPQQHFAQARMRAIELGLPLIRSANTGISAMVDPYGRVVAQIPLGEQGAIDVKFPAALSPTVYARMGDLPAGILWALIMGWLALRRAGSLY